MTRPATRKKISRKPLPAKPRPVRPTSDRAIYLGILLIGFFAVLLAAMFSELRYWPIFAVVYLAFVAYMIIANTYSVYRGTRLLGWQQALARIPLRFAGYGTKGGKPLEAAHDHPETRTALLLTILVSVVIVGGLAVLVWLSMR